ncbi:MAG: carbohydrate ABC transporter permease [Clostridia bacterium]|nr:carbohydrate ABC transporter permease [Clostridia bacterium]MBR5380640.1 carbohydrate ABC transporter permease [Clostridia bacterium]
MQLSHLKKTWADRAFSVVNTVLLVFALLIVALPILYVIAQSLSAPQEVIAGRVLFWPRRITFVAYREIFRSKMLLTGYKNSIIYTFTGTVVNVVMTVMCAYPLSRKDFVGRKQIMWLFVFTMIFSAPLIPSFINVRNLKMLNSIWAMIIPGAISAYNMVIARTFFMSNIPDEMIEAADLDGASDIQILVKLVLPLSKAVIAVLVLFYAVGHWNSYFDAFIYLQSEDKLPLQVILRNILANAKMIEEMANATAEQGERLALVEVLKYAVIVFGSLPVLILYPFVQKYFVKGIMIGSVKG